MNIVTLLSAVSLFFYLTLGFYVLAINTKSRTNVLFFILIFSLSLTSLSSAFCSMAENKEIFFYWIKAAVFFIIIFFALHLHFIAELTMILKKKTLFLIIAYLPVLMLLAIFPFSSKLLYIDVSRENNLWHYSFLNTFWTYLLYGYFIIYTIISLILLYIWGYKSKEKRIILQSRAIIISVCTVLLYGILDTIILPNIIRYSSLGLKHIMFLFWVTGLFYAIVKYRFLSVTPEFVSNYAIANISDSIILLNNEKKIIFINKKVEELLGIDEGKVINKNLSEIILKYDIVKNEINKMLHDKYKDFTCRVYLKTKKEPILMDMKISKVIDKFNDTIGILVIGNEVKELKQLKSFYKLTEREVEIVQLIIEGKSNKEIGTDTGLTENTVKTHVMNIFNKLNVKSRIEMINLLIEYNLMPKNPITKKILLLK
jgi:PAS domain S-box-containing protein